MTSYLTRSVKNLLGSFPSGTSSATRTEYYQLSENANEKLHKNALETARLHGTALPRKQFVSLTALKGIVS